jgi:hypothetical protein
MRAALDEPADIAARDLDAVRGYCGLPCKSGRIVALSSPKELLGIPGIVHVEFERSIGDVAIGKRLAASFFSGVTAFKLADRNGLPDLLRKLADTYRIEVTAP